MYLGTCCSWSSSFHLGNLTHYMNIMQIFTQKIWANNWTGTLRKLSILENFLGKVSSGGL